MTPPVTETPGDGRSGDARRLFVALRPPRPARESIAVLDLPPASGFRRVPEERLHVTLAFLGRCGVDPVTAALAGARLPSCTATLGPSVQRLGPKVVMVPVQGLEPLAEAVRHALEPFTEKPFERPFLGHLTLGRIRGRADEDHVRDLTAVLGQRVSASWRPTRLELVASVTDPGGALHEVLHRFPL